MWRPALLVSLLPLLLVLPVRAARAADEADSAAPTWYAQTLTRGEAGLNVTYFWSKGAWMRAETVVGGHKIITVVRGEWYYAWDALRGVGLAIRREPAVVAIDHPQRRPFGREHEILVRQGAELVREEKVLGRSAGIYRVTDDFGRRELWVTEDEARIPLRLEVFERSSGERRTIDWVNWQSDMPIPDAFFTPDASASLEQIDYAEYLKRSGETGGVDVVPVFYLRLLYHRQGD